MGRMTRITLIQAAVLAVAIASLAGCQQQKKAEDEPPVTPSEKQARLLAAQNVDLQKKLAEMQGRIDALRREHADELARRDSDLAQCKARNELLQKEIEQGIAERVKSVTAKVVDENARLRQEVERLQAEIARLKGDSPSAAGATEGQP